MNDSELNQENLEKHVRSNPGIYFPESEPSGIGIADILERTAKFLGATETKLVEVDGDFFFCGNIDWFIIENSWGLTEENLFKRFWPFPEAGVNSARIDAIASIYSNVLAAATPSSVRVYKGCLSTEQEARLVDLSAKWKRVVFFDFNENS